MRSDSYSINPYTRVFFLILSFIGAIICKDTLYMILFLSLALVPFFIINRKFIFYVRFFLFGILPIYVSFILLYVIIQKNQSQGWEYIHYRVIKLLLYTSIVQVFLSFKPQEIIDTMIALRIRGSNLMVILGAFSIWEDVIKRSNKIITARYARGNVVKRNLFNTVKQVPFALVPLINGVLRTSIERSESWQRKDIVNLVSNWKPKQMKTVVYSDLWLLISAIVFFVVNVYRND